MKNRKSILVRWPLLIGLVLILSCSSIAPFDQYAYVQVTSLKVDALSMMDEGEHAYSLHEREVKALGLKLAKAYEYERFRPLNAVTVEMYRVLLDPKGDLLGGYFVLWKEKGKLGSFYIAQKKAQVSAAFDEIALLESKKIKNK